jgi:hypothetical protein
MMEGWLEDDYYVLFGESEIPSASSRYGIEEHMPGMVVLGLRSWDDLLLRAADGSLYTVPSIPITKAYLEPFGLSIDATRLAPDARVQGRIKWYVQPIIFGGSPTEQSNLTWVTHEEHGQLVRFWNHKYREVAGNAT